MVRLRSRLVLVAFVALSFLFGGGIAEAHFVFSNGQPPIWTRMWIPDASSPDSRHHNTGCGFSDCTDFGFTMTEDVENFPMDAVGVYDPPGGGQTHIIWWGFRRYGGIVYSGSQTAYGTSQVFSAADNQGWSTSVLWCRALSPNYDYLVDWVTRPFTKQTASQQPYSSQQTFSFPCSSQQHASFMDYIFMNAATP